MKQQPYDELFLRTLQEQLSLERHNFISKESLILAIEASLALHIARGSTHFFQLLYRLDIDERRVTEALEDPDDGLTRIACLIYERQLQKMQSRRSSPPTNTDDATLKW